MPIDTPLLVLKDPTLRPNGYLAFYIPESVALGYAVELKAMKSVKRTHTPGFVYRGGKVDDLSFTLNLVVGVSYKINTTEQLEESIRQLFQLALPENPRRMEIEPVTAVILGRSGGSSKSWFSIKAFVSAVKSVYKGPIDVGKGRYRQAEVTFTLVPTYAPGSRGSAYPADLPSRQRWIYEA